MLYSCRLREVEKISAMSSQFFQLTSVIRYEFVHIEIPLLCKTKPGAFFIGHRQFLSTFNIGCQWECPGTLTNQLKEVKLSEANCIIKCLSNFWPTNLAICYYNKSRLSCRRKTKCLFVISGFITWSNDSQ